MPTQVPTPGGAPRRRRLATAALVVGYAMSRLDRRLLTDLNLKSWNAAFAAFGSALLAKPTSIKNLRDEFDPLHANPRRGWADRAMLPSRVRVAEELELASDAALVAMVREIFQGREAQVAEALDLLAPAPGPAAAAAERLLTGRRAEEYLIANCAEVLGKPAELLRDAREDLAGFDFELLVKPSIFVEVKGLRGRTGDLQFTDREWREAKRRQARYWLVVIAEAVTFPFANVLPDPSSRLEPRCEFQRSLRPTWRARFRAEPLASTAGLVAERAPSVSDVT